MLFQVIECLYNVMVVMVIAVRPQGLLGCAVMGLSVTQLRRTWRFRGQRAVEVCVAAFGELVYVRVFGLEVSCLT